MVTLYIREIRDHPGCIEIQTNAPRPCHMALAWKDVGPFGTPQPPDVFNVLRAAGWCGTALERRAYGGNSYSG